MNTAETRAAAYWQFVISGEVQRKAHEAEVKAIRAKGNHRTAANDEAERVLTPEEAKRISGGKA